jgi:hypothetical protein
VDHTERQAVHQGTKGVPDVISNAVNPAHVRVADYGVSRAASRITASSSAATSYGSSSAANSKPPIMAMFL